MAAAAAVGVVSAGGSGATAPLSGSHLRKKAIRQRRGLWRTAIEMSLAVFVLLLLACRYGFVYPVSATEETAESGEGEAVVTLSSENFTRFLESNPVAVVEFYAPWCGHCKRLAPEYEAAAQKLKEDGIPLAKVDATTDGELANSYGVSGYPTLKLFRDGEPEEFRGGRTKDTIVSWVKKVTGEAVVVVDNKAAAEAVVKDEGAAFVGHFQSTSSDTYGIFKGVAEKNRHWGKFVAFFSPSAPGTVTAYRKEDGSGPSVTVEDAAKLVEFLDLERFPYCGAISGENYNDYFTCGRTMVWLAGNKAQYEEALAIVKDAAKARRSTNNFVWLDTEEFKEHAENYLGVKQFPALVLHSKDGRYVYPETKIKDSASVLKFLQEVDEGKIAKVFLTEEIPEKNDEPVKVVVGKNFQEMVLRSDHDVMLEVYAPWCGHCKKFEPIYTTFAKNMETVYPKLVVAKLDGTTNEAPVDGFTWKGFPTVFFIKAGESTPMSYDGARSVEALTEFIKEHASFPLPTKDEL